MSEPTLHDSLAKFSEEAKRLEKSYEGLQQEQKSSLLVHHLPLGLITVDPQGIISHYNEAAGHLCGKPPLETLHHPYSSLFSDSLFGFSMEEVLKRQVLNKKIFLEFSTGKKITVTATFHTLLGVTLVLDEEGELEEAVEKNERLTELGKMAASLAHEIRNPLGGIEGFAALLYRDLSTNTPAQEMVKKILEGTRMLNRLVTNILHYAKPCEVHFVSHDLIHVIREVVEWLSHDRTCKTIDFETTFTTCPALIDKDLFKGALTNLVRNASEVTPTDKRVKITLTEECGGVAVGVHDQGRGISDEEKSRLFTPFFTTKNGGTGLGLAQAHKGVSALGGSIAIDSQIGKGSTFTIRLKR